MSTRVRRTRQGKSLRLDLVLPDIGRMQCSIGTTSTTRMADYKAMVRALQRDGRLAILRNLRDKVVSFPLVYEAFVTGKLDKLPSAETLLPLAAAWKEWLHDLERAPTDERRSDAHMRDCRWTLAVLLRAGGDAATLTDLPAIMETVRKTHRAMPRTFNKTMAHVRAFLRDTLRRQHTLYQQVAGIPVLPWTRKRAPKPQSVAQLREWEKTLDPKLMACVWSLATTGMNPKEFWTDGWEFAPHTIRVHGEKRAGRERSIPDLGRCAVPEIGKDHASRSLLVAAHGAFLLKDLRNTFANWMESAGIPRTRRRMYMGHGAADVTDLYEQQEVAQYLREDGGKLRAWLEAQGAPAITEVPLAPQVHLRLEA